MPVLVEDAAEAVVSVDVKPGGSVQPCGVPEVCLACELQ